MRKAVLTIILFSSAGLALRAQVPAGYVAVDSLVYHAVDAVDSKLEGKSVFSVVGSESSGVKITQDASIESAMAKHISANRNKHLSGYRIRIFFDNKQNSRTESEAALSRFRAAFPGIPAYRTFSNPFFKVTVGDFRTKSEAAQLLGSLKGMFPNAFVLKENINYPAVDKNSAYIVDTVKVLRKVGEETL